jgi:hypothetical protein
MKSDGDYFLERFKRLNVFERHAFATALMVQLDSGETNLKRGIHNALAVLETTTPEGRRRSRGKLISERIT